MTKSHVGMEYLMCTVCGTQFESGAILLDRRLRNSLERHTLTGWGTCPEHQAQLDDGYCHLIECNNTHTGETIKPEDADRTGKLLTIKRAFLAQVLNIEPAPIMFVDPEAAAAVERIFNRAREAQTVKI